MVRLSQLIHDFSATAASAQKLPVQLVRAIIVVESAGEPNAWRSEPRYAWLWDCYHHRPFRARDGMFVSSAVPPDDFPAHPDVNETAATEWAGQRASWGLMQIMGAVARERGYDEPFPLLCSPITGITWGCAQLAWLRDRFHAEHGWRGVAAAYNAGSPIRGADGLWQNQEYVNRIAAAGGFDDGLA